MSVQRVFKVPIYPPELVACYSHDGLMDNDVDSQRLHPEMSDVINVRLREVPQSSPLSLDVSEDRTLDLFVGRDFDDNEVEQTGYQIMSEILSANNPRPKND